MIKKWFALAAIVLVLNGCAARPEIRPEYVGLPKLENGWSRIYFSAGTMSGIKLWSVHQVGPVFINNQNVGMNGKDEHLVVDVLPGTYEAYCAPLEQEKNFNEKRQFTFISGETRYLACDMAPKGAGMYFGLIGALASEHLTKTYLNEKPLDPASKLVSYKKFQEVSATGK